MTGFLARHRQRFLTVAADHGLTPAHLGALVSLQPGDDRSMRSLAEAWHCDASNVTWLVDRLEERGLVRRESSPSDRRVKTVVLTKAGERLRDQVDTELSRPPEQMLALGHDDLAALHRILDRLGGDGGEPVHPL